MTTAHVHIDVIDDVRALDEGAHERALVGRRERMDGWARGASGDAQEAEKHLVVLGGGPVLVPGAHVHLHGADVHGELVLDEADDFGEIAEDDGMSIQDIDEIDEIKEEA